MRIKLLRNLAGPDLPNGGGFESDVLDLPDDLARQLTAPDFRNVVHAEEIHDAPNANP